MTEAFEFIQYETAGAVARLTFNRPEVMNALHPPAHAECSKALAAFEADAEARVLIITGAGDRAFCAGMDLHFRNSESVTPTPLQPGGFAGLTNPRDSGVTKPVIAAVNGYALGGGFEVAMACDIVIAAENAVFGLPEVKRGIVAGAGGIHRLPRQMPLRIAMGYLLTGRTMTAAEAYRWGLVNEVVPAGELLDAAERWAEEIVAGAPLSVRAHKQVALRSVGMPLEDAYNAHYPEIDAVRASNDSREGVAAFVERRAPRWTGT